MTAIDFYFDFASPYGYLASHRIDALAEAHGATVTWRPVMIGPAMEATGAKPLTATELKKAYTLIDVPRLARRWSVPLTLPARFPSATLAAGRAYYWLERSDPVMAKALARALLHRYWGEGEDIAPPEVVIDVAGGLGVDTAALGAALQDTEIKALFKTASEESMARGVFGSPWFLVDDEPFWGFDKLELLEDRLAGRF
jgi:2-hydroxychromene-2-carboxylate isomerase